MRVENNNFGGNCYVPDEDYYPRPTVSIQAMEEGISELGIEEIVELYNYDVAIKRDVRSMKFILEVTMLLMERKIKEKYCER